MTKNRFDQELLKRKLVESRSQADNLIKLGKVRVNGEVIKKSGHFVDENSEITLDLKEKYVSRAGLKLASVAKALKLDFKNKIILDVGSSTGGFTDYALQNGAKKVYAVDIGTNQLHPSLRINKNIELHEKTDIRSVFYFCKVKPRKVEKDGIVFIRDMPDIVLIDVSFISLRNILPHVSDNLSDENTQIVAMLKPQFEAGKGQTNKGVIKNEAIRRKILHNFEIWSRQYFVISNKRDSEVTGEKGNRERFYLLTLKRNSTTSSGFII